MKNAYMFPLVSGCGIIFDKTRVPAVVRYLSKIYQIYKGPASDPKFEAKAFVSVINYEIVEPEYQLLLLAALNSKIIQDIYHKDRLVSFDVDR